MGALGGHNGGEKNVFLLVWEVVGGYYFGELRQA